MLVDALCSKYERIRALRVAHDRATNDPSFSEPDPKPEMARLADAFPGALRDLDRLPFAEIERRLDQLRAAAEDPTRVEGWMLAEYELHRYTRGALATKRWLVTQPAASEAELEAAFRAALPSLCEEAALFATSLQEITAPLRGRIMDVVFMRVAGDLGVPERELRALVRV